MMDRFVTATVGLVLLFSVLVCVVLSEKDCGGLFTEDKGVLTTPNFPKPYPTPKRCTYVITRGKNPHKKIFLYFTQFYLRAGVYIEEYSFFISPDHPANLARNPIGTIEADLRPTDFVSFKEFLVIDVHLDRVVNNNLRVLDQLMDVHGFNITYEIVNKDEISKKDTHVCIDDQCKYTGVCFADVNMTTYTCNCFPGFWGNACQWSAKCNDDGTGDIGAQKAEDTNRTQDSSTTACKNGGHCEHFMGSTTSVCICPDGFKGRACEIPDNRQPSECALKGCDLGYCLNNSTASANCSCEAGLQLQGSGNGCFCEKGWRLEDDECERVRYRGARWFVKGRHLDLMDERHEVAFRENLGYLSQAVLSVTAMRTSEDSVIVRFNVLSDKAAEVENVLKKLTLNGRLLSWKIETSYFNFQLDDYLSILSFTTRENPVYEDSELVLACMVTGPDGLTIRWLKDGFPVQTDTNGKTIWSTIVPKNSDGVFTGLLGFDRTQYVDKGLFTCEAHDQDQVRKRSLRVLISASPTANITPLASTVQRGNSIKIFCLAYNPHVGYKWYKNGDVLYDNGRLTDDEYVEDITPAGSQLTINRVLEVSRYTCEVSGRAGTTKKESHIFVSTETSKFCETETSFNATWTKTVVGGYDVHQCPENRKGEASRRCEKGDGGEPQWSIPDYSRCAYHEIYQIRKLLLSLIRGYQLTSVDEILRDVRSYVKKRAEVMLPGEGNSILEVLQEVLEYHGGLQDNHGENTTLVLFLDCITLTLSIENSVLNENFYAQLNDMIPQYVSIYLSGQKDLTSFSYNNKLFDVTSRVFNVGGNAGHDSDTVSVYQVAKEYQQQGLMAYLLKPTNNRSESAVVLNMVVYKQLSTLYLSRLPWLRSLQGHHLASRLVNLNVATRFVNGSLITLPHDRVYLNLRTNTSYNGTLSCAKIKRGSDVSLLDTELIRVAADEYSCSSWGSHLYAFYEMMVEEIVPAETDDLAFLAETCAASVGFFVAFLCLLSITCTSSCWSVFKSAKLNVCISLLALYMLTITGAVNLISSPHVSLIRSLRHFCLLVVVGEQLVVLTAIYTELFDKRNLKGSAFRMVALPWIVSSVLVSIALAVENYADTNKLGLWGTLGSTVTLSSAWFTLLTIVASMVFILLAFEINISSDPIRGRQVSTQQQGMIKKSLFIMIALAAHSLSTTGYVSDPNKVYSAVSSIVLALVVFLVYASYCETVMFYDALWGWGSHRNKQQDVKSIASQ